MEVRWGGAHHPRCRDSHLLLDLFQNVGHLAEEILRGEETQVTTSSRACLLRRHPQKALGKYTAYYHQGLWSYSATPKSEVVGARTKLTGCNEEGR